MDSILTGNMKKLLGRLPGQLPAFRETTYFQTQQRMTFLGHEYEVVSGYNVIESPLTGRNVFSGAGVAAFDPETGKMADYVTNRRIKMQVMGGTADFRNRDELTRFYNEQRYADVEEFLTKNQDHAKLASGYGDFDVQLNSADGPEKFEEYLRNFDSYLQSADYAKATAAPVRIETGTINLDPRNYYGIDLNDYPVTRAVGPDGAPVIEGSGRIDLEYSLYSDGSIAIDVKSPGWTDADISRLESELTGSHSFKVDMTDRYERRVGTLIENNSEMINTQFDGNVNAFLDGEINPNLTELHLQSSDVLVEQGFTTRGGIEGVITTRCDGTVTAEVPQGPNRESWNYNDYEAKVEAFQSDPEVQKLTEQARMRYEWEKERGFPDHNDMVSDDMTRMQDARLDELSQLHREGAISSDEFDRYGQDVMDGKFSTSKESMKEIIAEDARSQDGAIQNQGVEPQQTGEPGTMPSMDAESSAGQTMETENINVEQSVEGTDVGYHPTSDQQKVWEAQDEHWKKMDEAEAAHQEDIRSSREEVWKAQDKHWEDLGYEQDGPRAMEAPAGPEIEPAANFTPQTVHVETVDGMSGDFHIDAHGNIQVFSDTIQGAPGISPAEHLDAFMGDPSVQNAMLKAQSSGTMLHLNNENMELVRNFTINTPDGPMRAQMSMDLQGRADIIFPDRNYEKPGEYFKAEAEAFNTPEGKAIYENMDSCRNVLNNQFSAVQERISNLEGLRLSPEETLGQMKNEAFFADYPAGKMIDVPDMMDANETLLGMPDYELAEGLNALGAENPQTMSFLSQLLGNPVFQLALAAGIAALVIAVTRHIIEKSHENEQLAKAAAEKERQQQVAKELGKTSEDKGADSMHAPAPENHADGMASMLNSAGNGKDTADTVAEEDEKNTVTQEEPSQDEDGSTASPSDAQQGQSDKNDEKVAPAMEKTIDIPENLQPDISEEKTEPKSEKEKKEEGMKESVSEDAASDKEKDSTGPLSAEKETQDADMAKAAEEEARREDIEKDVQSPDSASPQHTDEQQEIDDAMKEAADSAAKEYLEGIGQDSENVNIEELSKEQKKEWQGRMNDAMDEELGRQKDVIREKTEADAERMEKGREEAPADEHQISDEEIEAEKRTSIPEMEDKDEASRESGGAEHDSPAPENIPEQEKAPAHEDKDGPAHAPEMAIPAAAAKIEKHENALISWEIDEKSGSLILGGDITKKGLQRVLEEAEKDAAAKGYRIDNIVIGNETRSLQPCALTALSGRDGASPVNPMNLVLEIDKKHKDAYRTIEECKTFIIPEELKNVAVKGYAPDACLSGKDSSSFRNFHAVVLQDVDFIPSNFMAYAKIDILTEKNTDPAHRTAIGDNSFGNVGPEVDKILETEEREDDQASSRSDDGKKEKSEHQLMEEKLKPLGHLLSNEHGGWMLDEKESAESISKLNASMERDDVNRLQSLIESRDALIRKRDELVANTKNSPSWIIARYKETEDYEKRRNELKGTLKLDGKSIAMWTKGQCGGCDVWDRKIEAMQKSVDDLITRFKKLNIPELEGVIKDLKDLKERDFKGERAKLVEEFMNSYLDAVVCSEYMKTPEFAERMKTFDIPERADGYKEISEVIERMDAEIAVLTGRHRDILSAEDMQNVNNARLNHEMLVGLNVSSYGKSAFENQAIRLLPGKDALDYAKRLENMAKDTDDTAVRTKLQALSDNIRRGKVVIVPNGMSIAAYAMANTGLEGVAQDRLNHIALIQEMRRHESAMKTKEGELSDMIARGEDPTQKMKEINEEKASHESKMRSMIGQDAALSVIDDMAFVSNDNLHLTALECSEEKQQALTANCGRNNIEKREIENISLPSKTVRKFKATDLEKEKRDFEKKERGSGALMALGVAGDAFSRMTDKDYSTMQATIDIMKLPLFFLAVLLGKTGKGLYRMLKGRKEPDYAKMFSLSGNSSNNLALAGADRYAVAATIAKAAMGSYDEDMTADVKSIGQGIDPNDPKTFSMIAAPKEAQALMAEIISSDYKLGELGKLLVDIETSKGDPQENVKKLLEKLENIKSERESDIRSQGKETGEKSYYKRNSKEIEQHFEKDRSKLEHKAESIIKADERKKKRKDEDKTKDGGSTKSKQLERRARRKVANTMGHNGNSHNNGQQNRRR